MTTESELKEHLHEVEICRQWLRSSLPLVEGRAEYLGDGGGVETVETLTAEKTGGKQMTAKVLQFKPRADDHFGLCPTCKAEPALLNIEKANFAYCREHKLYWDIGWNLLGSWRHETEKDWQRNRETLDAAYAVEPFHYARRKGW